MPPQFKLFRGVSISLFLLLLCHSVPTMGGEDCSTSSVAAPRLCHLIKWPHFQGYGFNLHSEKNREGQFIGKIDAHSPAEACGLCEGDRIFEVNGVNISNENHRQVVERIKSVPESVKLLVLSPDAVQFYRDGGMVVTGDMDGVVSLHTPTADLQDVANPLTSDQTDCSNGHDNLDCAHEEISTSCGRDGMCQEATTAHDESSVVEVKASVTDDERTECEKSAEGADNQDGSGENTQEEAESVGAAEQVVGTPEKQDVEGMNDVPERVFLEPDIVEKAEPNSCPVIDKENEGAEGGSSPKHSATATDDGVEKPLEEREAMEKSEDPVDGETGQTCPRDPVSRSNECVPSSECPPAQIDDVAVPNDQLHETQLAPGQVLDESHGKVSSSPEESNSTSRLDSPNTEKQKCVDTSSPVPSVDYSSDSTRSSCTTAALEDCGSPDDFGLKLNMTAAEMKQYLKSKKRPDPRNTNLTFKERHEIISNM